MGERLAAWVFLIFIGGIPILVDASSPAGVDTNYFVTAGKMNSLFLTLTVGILAFTDCFDIISLTDALGQDRRGGTYATS
jgi:hypothetical protein